MHEPWPWPRLGLALGPLRRRPVHLRGLRDLQGRIRGAAADPEAGARGVVVLNRDRERATFFDAVGLDVQVGRRLAGLGPAARQAPDEPPYCHWLPPRPCTSTKTIERSGAGHSGRCGCLDACGPDRGRSPHEVVTILPNPLSGGGGRGDGRGGGRGDRTRPGLGADVPCHVDGPYADAPRGDGGEDGLAPIEVNGPSGEVRYSYRSSGPLAPNVTRPSGCTVRLETAPGAVASIVRATAAESDAFPAASIRWRLYP